MIGLLANKYTNHYVDKSRQEHHKTILKFQFKKNLLLQLYIFCVPRVREYIQLQIVAMTTGEIFKV